MPLLYVVDWLSKPGTWLIGKFYWHWGRNWCKCLVQARRDWRCWLGCVWGWAPNVPKELFELDNVVLAPHMAVFTQESFMRLGIWKLSFQINPCFLQSWMNEFDHWWLQMGKERNGTHAKNNIWCPSLAWFVKLLTSTGNDHLCQRSKIVHLSLRSSSSMFNRFSIIILSLCEISWNKL